MSGNSERAKLAAAQAELVRALLEEGPAPDGFDEARVTAQARVLAAKRRRLAERHAAMHGRET